MTVAMLRAECPSWRWKAIRKGFGYEYSGQRGSATVTVGAVSVLVGEDDFESRWNVDDGRVATDYASWWIAQDPGWDPSGVATNTAEMLRAANGARREGG